MAASPKYFEEPFERGKEFKLQARSSSGWSDPLLPSSHPERCSRFVARSVLFRERWASWSGSVEGGSGSCLLVWGEFGVGGVGEFQTYTHVTCLVPPIPNSGLCSIPLSRVTPLFILEQCGSSF